MTPNEVAAELPIIVDAGLSAFLHGPPGIGKSQVVAAFAEENEYELRDVRASQLDPVDARGVPVPIPDKHVTSWYPPDFLPTEGKGIIFLDELNRANQDTQSALYQLILERRIGDYSLPEDWHIIAAGNNEIDGCMVQPMSRALKNRFIHLEMRSDYDDWHRWAHRSGISEEVIAFMKARPNLLDEVATANRGNSKKMDVIRNSNAFATPRSWEFASKIIQQAKKVVDKKGEPKPRKIRDLYGVLEGTVGEGAATEFVTYCDIYMELPDIEAMIKNPDKYDMPEEPHKLYAVCTGLAARADKNNFGNIKKLTDKMGKEYAVWTIKDCLARNREDIKKHPMYKEWIYKNIEYAA